MSLGGTCYGLSVFVAMEIALKGHLVQIIFHLTLGRACVCG